MHFLILLLSCLSALSLLNLVSGEIKQCTAAKTGTCTDSKKDEISLTAIMIRDWEFKDRCTVDFQGLNDQLPVIQLTSNHCLGGCFRKNCLGKCLGGISYGGQEYCCPGATIECTTGPCTVQFRTTLLKTIKFEHQLACTDVPVTAPCSGSMTAGCLWDNANKELSPGTSCPQTIEGVTGSFPKLLLKESYCPNDSCDSNDKCTVPCNVGIMFKGTEHCCGGKQILCDSAECEVTLFNHDTKAVDVKYEFIRDCVDPKPVACYDNNNFCWELKSIGYCNCKSFPFAERKYNCAKTCGMCGKQDCDQGAPICKDNHESCESLKEDGFCNEEQYLVEFHCAETCGKCLLQ